MKIGYLDLLKDTELKEYDVTKYLINEWQEHVGCFLIKMGKLVFAQLCLKFGTEMQVLKVPEELASDLTYYFPLSYNNIGGYIGVYPNGTIEVEPRVVGQMFFANFTYKTRN